MLPSLAVRVVGQLLLRSTRFGSQFIISGGRLVSTGLLAQRFGLNQHLRGMVPCGVCNLRSTEHPRHFFNPPLLGQDSYLNSGPLSEVRFSI